MKRIGYTFYPLGRLVCFTHPEEPDLTLIKRISGGPGDVIPLGDDQVHHLSQQHRSHIAWNAITVPQGSIWVSSDETFRGKDSKHFGPVPMGLVQGLALGIIYPWNRIGSSLEKS